MCYEHSDVSENDDSTYDDSASKGKIQTSSSHFGDEIVIKIDNLNEIRDDGRIDSDEGGEDEQLRDINRVCDPEFMKETNAMWEGIMERR